jgi:hypothetical protein
MLTLFAPRRMNHYESIRFKTVVKQGGVSEVLHGSCVGCWRLQNKREGGVSATTSVHRCAHLSHRVYHHHLTYNTIQCLITESSLRVLLKRGLAVQSCPLDVG